MGWILESERLRFRRMTEADFSDLCGLLQDADVMYAWEHGFSREEARGFMERTLARYATDGFGHFAAIEKETGAFTGVIGPIIEVVEDVPYTGLGYLLKKEYWGRGYATEGAKACMDYAFTVLGAETVIAEIRLENLPSRRVAERLGMRVERTFVKRYRGGTCRT
ncbi:MAG TPA: GNAT family N-acetyltransferase [Feifaniaceae bacterium]|nr:GNAT family N-acetyltransferase [Feifaniaceae bacterium]